MTGRELVEPTDAVLPVIDVRAAYASDNIDLLVADLRAQTFYYAGYTHTVPTVVSRSTTRAGSYTLRVNDLDLAATGPDREDAWAEILTWAELWNVTLLWEGGAAWWREIFGDRFR